LRRRFISYFEAARKTAGAGAATSEEQARRELVQSLTAAQTSAGQSKTVLGVGAGWFRTCGDNG